MAKSTTLVPLRKVYPALSAPPQNFPKTAQITGRSYWQVRGNAVILGKIWDCQSAMADYR